MELHVVVTLPSERYVAAVLNAEAAPNEPAQSLQALAIVARTYALNGSHFTPQSGELPADLCDSTQCQAMRLGLYRRPSSRQCRRQRVRRSGSVLVARRSSSARAVADLQKMAERCGRTCMVFPICKAIGTLTACDAIPPLGMPKFLSRTLLRSPKPRVGAFLARLWRRVSPIEVHLIEHCGSSLRMTRVRSH